MKKSPRSLQRDRFVEVARLRRILTGFELAHGQDPDVQVESEGDSGKLVVNDGEGNHACAFWDAAGVVALHYVHDIPEARVDPSPSRHLAGAPPELAALVAAACAFGPKLATSGAWALGDVGGGGWREMMLLDAYTRPPHRTRFHVELKTVVPRGSSRASDT